jgi:hypothetical protein
VVVPIVARAKLTSEQQLRAVVGETFLVEILTVACHIQGRQASDFSACVWISFRDEIQLSLSCFHDVLLFALLNALKDGVAVFDEVLCGHLIADFLIGHTFKHFTHELVHARVFKQGGWFDQGACVAG